MCPEQVDSDYKHLSRGRVLALGYQPEVVPAPPTCQVSSEHDVPRGIRTKYVSLIIAIKQNSFQRDPLRTVLKRSVRDRGRTGKWGGLKGC